MLQNAKKQAIGFWAGSMPENNACIKIQDLFSEQESELVIQMTNMALSLSNKIAVFKVTPAERPQEALRTLNTGSTYNLGEDPDEIKYSRITSVGNQAEAYEIYEKELRIYSTYPFSPPVSVLKDIQYMKHPFKNTKVPIIIEYMPTTLSFVLPTFMVQFFLTEDACLKAVREAYPEALNLWEIQKERLQACKNSFDEILNQNNPMVLIFSSGHTNKQHNCMLSLCEETHREALEHDTEQLFPKRPLALTWRP
jgi:hypothetical protein